MVSRSKPYKKRTKLYEENKDRRVRCPDWSFSSSFLTKLQKGADFNNVSKSRYFETVVQNFFLLEDPKIVIRSKRDYGTNDKKKTPRLTLHPQVIEDIKEYSKQSAPSTSKYIEYLFTKYHTKYGYQIKLRNLIYAMQN